MADLESNPAEMHFTLEITRAATGIVEVIDMVGHVIPEPQSTQSPEGDDDGRNP